MTETRPMPETLFAVDRLAAAGWRPGLVAVDVDDTLVGRDGIVGQRVRDSFARARAAGTEVVLATGRTLSTTAPVGVAAGLDGWAVCSNGAVLARVEPEQVVETETFDPGPVLSRLREALPHAVFAVEDVHGVFHTTEPFPTGPLGMSILHAPMERLLAEPVVRLVVRSEEHAENGFGEVVRELGLHGVIFGVADVAWMDIGPRGVSKASMLDHVRERLGVAPQDTMAFGDNYNDVDMLRWAGRGIAMASAPESVAAAADIVTSGTPGDGVADVLDRLFP
ncbi:MAG: HAD family hydrolase [Candidatus Nanopelagicales bacterium]